MRWLFKRVKGDLISTACIVQAPVNWSLSLTCGRGNGEPDVYGPRDLITSEMKRGENDPPAYREHELEYLV